MAPCTIRFCNKKSQSSSFLTDGITFHRYPHDPDLKNKWKIATKRENWVPSAYSVICSRHFTDDCFIPMKNRRRLLSSAVPTKYLPVLSVTDHSDISTPDFGDIKGDPVGLDVKPTGSPLMSPKLKSLMSVKRFPGSPSDYATPEKKRLCSRVIELSQKVLQKNVEIKNLRQKIRYMRKRLVSLKSIVKELENQKVINTCNADNNILKTNNAVK